MGKRGYSTIFVFAILCGAPAGAARLVRTGEEFQVSTVTSEDQREPGVCVGPSGDFVVVWNGPAARVAGGVFARRYASDGAPLGTEFRVNPFPDDSPPLAAVTCTGDGGFVVVWDQMQGDEDSSGILARRFASSGVALGAAIHVNTYVSGFQAYPAVAAKDDGAFVVTWMSSLEDGSLGGIFAQRFNSEGARIGGEFHVNSSTAGQQDSPSVAMSVDGAFVVVWDTDTYDPDIRGQRFASSGAPLGSEFVVNQYTDYAQIDPHVAVIDDSQFLVVWEDDSERDQSGAGIAARRFSGEGSPIGDEFQVPVYTLDDQFQPAVAASGRSFAIAWSGSFDADGSQYGVFSGRVDGADGDVAREFQVASFTLLDQQYPAVGANRAGRLVVVWQRENEDLGTSSIVGQRFSMAASCAGDCNDDESVAITELVRGVSLGLGNAKEDCLVAFDLDENGQVSISEVIVAVQRALVGCGSQPTPQIRSDP